MARFPAAERRRTWHRPVVAGTGVGGRYLFGSGLRRRSIAMRQLRGPLTKGLPELDAEGEPNDVAGLGLTSASMRPTSSCERMTGGSSPATALRARSLGSRPAYPPRPMSGTSSGGSKGIVASRGASTDFLGGWIYDLWLLERLAAKLEADPLPDVRLTRSWTPPYLGDRAPSALDSLRGG